MDEREREHIRDSLVALRELARSLVDDTMPTFEAAEAMWSTAFTGGRGGRDGDHCHALWLLWGALTDWIDYRPEAGPEIEAAMRRAASQWLEVADDELRWPLLRPLALQGVRLRASVAADRVRRVS